MLHKLLWIALAGAMGTLARYGLGGFVQNYCDKLFPWGTAAVNLLGCLLFGLAFSILEERWRAGGAMRTIVLVGFLGGFTTFSSFVFETEELLHDAQWLAAAGNFTLHNLGGLAALIAGIAIGRLV